MMSGIKMTVFIPTINQLIRSVISTVLNENASMQYILVLCHSTMRCSEIEEFLKQLTNFCKDIIDVVNLYSGDL